MKRGRAHSCREAGLSLCTTRLSGSRERESVCSRRPYLRESTSPSVPAKSIYIHRPITSSLVTRPRAIRSKLIALSYTRPDCTLSKPHTNTQQPASHYVPRLPIHSRAHLRDHLADPNLGYARVVRRLVPARHAARLHPLPVHRRPPRHNLGNNHAVNVPTDGVDADLHSDRRPLLVRDPYWGGSGVGAVGAAHGLRAVAGPERRSQRRRHECHLGRRHRRETVHDAQELVGTRDTQYHTVLCLRRAGLGGLASDWCRRG